MLIRNCRGCGFTLEKENNKFGEFKVFVVIDSFLSHTKFRLNRSLTKYCLNAYTQIRAKY